MTRHAPLRATWSEGQRWETRNEDSEQWVPVGNRGYAEPVWDERQEYRQVEPVAAHALPATPVVDQKAAEGSDKAAGVKAVSVADPESWVSKAMRLADGYAADTFSNAPDPRDSRNALLHFLIRVADGAKEADRD